ncbi:MAG TPA: serine/threonine-protein kinase [Myxococcota bacterium]|nr:serine/threonine-protein kinase [Myxococcota bacterium]
MDRSSAPGRQQITLLHERSGGTFARVYLAQVTGTGGLTRLVAVKVLREKWNDADEFHIRTQDEARMLARLRHPNIVRVEEMTELDGQLAIVMEFVDGLDLKQVVEHLAERKERLPPRAAYQICAKVASALDAAYRKTPYGHEAPLQVVHRDIKPSNIMLTQEGEIKVLDFGTARGFFEGREAETAMLRFGSLKYMSPERREGDRGEHTSDIYSLGLLLMELLEGQWLKVLPDGPRHHEALRKAAGAISDTGMSETDWDHAVRKVLLQMCADRPGQRPTGEQAVKLLRAFADRARGPSLEDFCADSMGQLVDLAFPDEEEPSGVLAGKQVYIDPRTSGDQPRPTQPEAAPPRARRPRRTPGRVPVEDLEAPTPLSGFRPEPEPPVEHIVQHAVAGPNLARPPEPVGEPVGEPADEPDPIARPPPPPLPPSPAEVPKKRGVLGPLLMVGFAVAALGFLVVLVGGTAAWLYYRSDPIAPIDDQPPIPLEIEGSVPVAVQIDGDTVQWVRLLQAGERALDGDELGLQGEVPEGDYTLAVKVVGRSTAYTDLHLVDALELRCWPEKDGQVHCQDEASEAGVLVLVAD